MINELFLSKHSEAKNPGPHGRSWVHERAKTGEREKDAASRGWELIVRAQ